MDFLLLLIFSCQYKRNKILLQTYSCYELPRIGLKMLNCVLCYLGAQTLSLKFWNLDYLFIHFYFLNSICILYIAITISLPFLLIVVVWLLWSVKRMSFPLLYNPTFCCSSSQDDNPARDCTKHDIKVYNDNNNNNNNNNNSIIWF